MARDLTYNIRSHKYKVKSKQDEIKKKEAKIIDTYNSICASDYKLLKDNYTKMRKGEFVQKDIYFSCKILFEGYDSKYLVSEDIYNEAVLSNSLNSNVDHLNLYWKYKVFGLQNKSKHKLPIFNKSMPGYKGVWLTEDGIFSGSYKGAMTKVSDIDIIEPSLLNIPELDNYSRKVREYAYIGANAFITVAIKIGVERGTISNDIATRLLNSFKKYYSQLPCDINDNGKSLNEYMNYFVLACILRDNELSKDKYGWLNHLSNCKFNVVLVELSSLMKHNGISL